MLNFGKRRQHRVSQFEFRHAILVTEEHPKPGVQLYFIYPNRAVSIIHIFRNRMVQTQEQLSQKGDVQGEWLLGGLKGYCEERS